MEPYFPEAPVLQVHERAGGPQVPSTGSSGAHCQPSFIPLPEGRSLFFPLETGRAKSL